MTSLVPFAMTTVSSSGLSNPQEAFPFFIIGGFIASSGLVWAFAPTLARLITRGTGEGLVLPGSLRDWYSIGFVVIGLYHVSERFGGVITWFHFFLKRTSGGHLGDVPEQIDWYGVTGAFIPFAIGIVLLLNARRWGCALAKKHEHAQQELESLQ